MLFKDLDKEFENIGYKKISEDFGDSATSVYNNCTNGYIITIVVSENLKSRINITNLYITDVAFISFNIKLIELLIKKYIQMKVYLRSKKKETING